MLAKAIDGESEQEVESAILGALGRGPQRPRPCRSSARAAQAASGLFASRKNSGLRVAAVYALGEARTPGAHAIYQSLVNDRDRDVREAVAKTLLLMRGTAA